ncbi:MAG: hypothetical protein JW863_12150 [Chitinispirillaceae bacterium]|nr:hypothetical protein [Chitinispirillaceae bacterium]
MMTTQLAQKAFAVVEAAWALENALWELFYEEFLTFCEEKTEHLQTDKTEGGTANDVR